MAMVFLRLCFEGKSARRHAEGKGRVEGRFSVSRFDSRNTRSRRDEVLFGCGTQTMVRQFVGGNGREEGEKVALSQR